MPSLSPPKFVQMLRGRDQDDLLATLRVLADTWDDPDSEVVDGLAQRQLCAQQLRKALDLHK